MAEYKFGKMSQMTKLKVISEDDDSTRESNGTREDSLKTFHIIVTFNIEDLRTNRYPLLISDVQEQPFFHRGKGLRYKQVSKQ